MHRLQREPFVADAQFACTRPFVMAGVAYKSGDVVDTATVEARRLRQMYEARMIDPMPRKLPALLKAAPERSAERALAPSGKTGIEHRGFGRWYVVGLDGRDVQGPLTREEAEAFLK